MGSSRGWAIPFAVACIVAVGYLVLLRPQFATLRDLRSHRATPNRIPELRAAAARWNAARSAIDVLPASNRAEVDAIVPPTEDVPSIFVAIDAAAQRSGVSVVAIDVTRDELPPDAAVRDVQASAISLSIRSVDYPRLKSFLGVLAASRRLFDIRSVQFTPSALTASVRLRTYRAE